MNETKLRAALIEARDWFESQAKAVSKGCGSSYELHDLRVQRDALDAALAAPAQAVPPDDALPWPWETDAEVLDDAISHIEGQDRLKAALRSIAARTTPAAAPAEAARAGWNACLRNLFSLTDETGDEAAARETSEFFRGRVFEAKGVARAMNSFGPEHCDDLQAYFTPRQRP